MVGKILFPDDIVLKGKHFIVNQDWEVPIPGLFILAPKRKVRSIAEFSKEESKEFMEIIIKLRRGMKEVLGIDDVYLFQNEDSEHNFHVWVFPRLAWMERFGRKIESVRPIMEYAIKNMAGKDGIAQVKQAAAKIREYMGE